MILLCLCICIGLCVCICICMCVCIRMLLILFTKSSTILNAQYSTLDAHISIQKRHQSNTRRKKLEKKNLKNFYQERHVGGWSVEPW